LQALGYINYAHTGFRPWTRASITHVLNQTAEFQDFTSKDDEAYEIYLAVRKELNTGTHTFADLGIRATALKVPIPVSAASQGLH
jgi:hypothetical protein